MRLTSAESSRCATFLSRRSNAVLSKAFFWYPSITRTVPSPSFFANSVLSKVLSVPICSPCSLPSSSTTLTSSFGWSRPNPFKSFSSARSFFCFRVDKEATSESTALSSPSASTGCASFQPFSPFVRRTTSWPSFERRNSFTWALSKSNSFSLFSFASPFFCSSLPAQSASPAMPPATSSSASRPTSVFVVCFMARSPALAGLPDHQPGEEQPEGEQVEGEEGHRALLLGREEQVVALALLWPDGDARLFLGYPGHRVQGEVLVSGEAEVAVGGEQGVADDDHPRFGALGRAGGERDRALEILARIEFDLPGRERARFAPGAFTGLGQLRHRPPRRGGRGLRHRARDGEDGGERERRAARLGDGVLGVALCDGDLGILRFRIDHLVLADVDAPAFERSLQPALRSRVHHHYELAALLHPVLDQLGLAVGERRDRAGDDQGLSVRGHLLVLGEHDLVGLVSLALEIVGEQLEAALGVVGDGVLAVALGEVDLLGRTTRHLDQRVGERLLADLLRARLLVPALHDHPRSRLRDVHLLDAARMLERVHELDAELVRLRLVLAQPRVQLHILGLAAGVERLHRDRLLEALEHADGLVGEGEDAVLGKVPALRLLHHDVVDSGQRGDEDQRRHRADRPVERAP